MQRKITYNGVGTEITVIGDASQSLDSWGDGSWGDGLYGA
jgi:hypothetical protein